MPEGQAGRSDAPRPADDPGRTVFISYRVDDTGPTASRLFEDLAGGYGGELVFLDHERLEGGAAWPERLVAEARRAAVMLVLIGEGWLRAHDPKTFVRRLDQASDWVRREIEVALGDAGALVVPLLVEEAELPGREAFATLPSLARLADLQTLRLRRKDWAGDLDRLHKLLQERGFVRRDGSISSLPPQLLEALVRERTTPLRELAATQRKLIARLERELELNERQLRAALEAAGEAEVAPERLAAKLVEIAGRYKHLREDVHAAPGDAPRVAGLKARIVEAIERAELERADAELAELADAQQALLERAALEAAATHARRGEVQLARLRYDEAAERFARAAELVPPGHEMERLGYFDREVSALYAQGFERGLNAPLEAAIERVRALLPLHPRERDLPAWARTQLGLGSLLVTLGAREARTARLEEGVAVLRAALEDCSRERDALLWATIQAALGGALQQLGLREAGTARLQEAAAAYNIALAVMTPESGLFSLVRAGLGSVYSALGARAVDTKPLEEEVALLRATLEGASRERDPTRGRAMAQVSLGLMLTVLGGREAGTARLQEALALFRAGAEEWPRERTPLEWARFQVLIGGVLTMLGEKEADAARLEEAVTGLRMALEEATRERDGPLWALTQVALGSALESLGAREAGTARLEEAIAAYRAAMEVTIRERVPLDWANIQHGLGLALFRLGAREAEGTARLEEAVALFRAALEERTRERVLFNWALTQMQLGDALAALGGRQASRALLEDAITAYDATLAILEQGRADHYVGLARGARARAVAMLKTTRGRAGSR